jgi:molybdopterin converting factor small subunit
MTVTLKFNQAFNEYTNKRESIEVAGSTIKESLESLMSVLPVFRDLLYDQSGALAVMIMHQGDLVLPNQLDRPVKNHDEVLVMPMIYGG